MRRDWLFQTDTRSKLPLPVPYPPPRSRLNKEIPFLVQVQGNDLRMRWSMTSIRANRYRLILLLGKGWALDLLLGFDRLRLGSVRTW